MLLSRYGEEAERPTRRSRNKHRSTFPWIASSLRSHDDETFEVQRMMLKETCHGRPRIRAALDRHWAASDADDFEAEHEIYQEDAVLEYPQSGERIRGRRNIQASRTVQPNQKRFTVGGSSARATFGSPNLF